MKKKSITVAILTIMLAASTILSGCSGSGTETQKKTETSVEQTDQKDTDQKEKEEKEEQKEAELADGVYKADFVTDNGMFQVNEAYDGKGTLTVKDGEMTIHVSLRSKKIVNLYVGLAKNAKNDEKNLLEPTTDTVTYSDGTTEEVYGFDVPVKALDQEFDLALIGTKGKWYDHKVYVTNPTPVEEEGTKTEISALEDGNYTMEITFEGGSGKATILSPVKIKAEGGAVTATVQWDSPNYDYMIVDGTKYLPSSTEGGSVFEIPVSAFDEPVSVIGDTVAMSKPHEIEYTLTFHSDTLQAVK